MMARPNCEEREEAAGDRYYPCRQHHDEERQFYVCRDFYRPWY